MAVWVREFQVALQEGFPLLTAAPEHIVTLLLGNRIDDIQETAWLVIFYGITFGNMPANEQHDAADKNATRTNLRLALDDARVLLHPTEVGVQALTLLACDIEEFITPSLCWMLVSNACRMLQCLQIDNRHQDVATTSRRLIMFWTLNALDQSLALIFGRSPTFHRAMIKATPMPGLASLVMRSPTHNGPAFLFGAHFLRQIFLLSAIMADVWATLYDLETDTARVEKAKQATEDWYREATQILDATALVEQPLLNADMLQAVQAGMQYVRFIYYHLTILLTRGCERSSEECTSMCQKMLHLLAEYDPNFDDPFNGIGVLWQLLYVPFTPFFVLFGRIVSDCKQHPERCRQALQAMERLPAFLKVMSGRLQQAGKLEPIAITFIDHARSLLDKRNRLSSQARKATGAQDGRPLQDLTAESNPDQDLHIASTRLTDEVWTEETDLRMNHLFKFLGPSKPQPGQTPRPTHDTHLDTTSLEPGGNDEKDVWQLGDQLDMTIEDWVADPSFDWFAWEQSEL
ncbi:hypothetical protein LTR62_008449 [Meristemomyces frigidus]|uniref:Xylanolytic transcriptional activator regulatory domain-containing protein n=1 Tax=Meristemomyces frigidus TaxID=1508187 RepID=A0AAN7TMM1_9PEZI|nr:hypothetical protein LTR62_008449 [Meristemomyces frigidus]